MRILTKSLGGNTQLDYEVTTTPFPLQASPSDVTQPLTTASLTVVASNQGNHPVPVTSIQISFDIAPQSDPDDATYLTSIGSGITFQVLSDPQQKIWTVSNDNNGNLTATAVAPGGVVIDDAGFAFVASGIQPNRSVGSFNLTISEVVKGTQTQDVIELSKFPAGFFMTNFRSDLPVVPQGGATTLYWNASSGAALNIIYAGGTPAVTNQTSWPTGNLTADTAYMLQATIGDLAVATLSLTVQVTQPILDLTSLTVEQTALLKGAVTAQSTLGVAGAATVGGTLNVAGAATLSNGATVTGAVSATGAVTAGGAVTGASVSATGAVSATSLAIGTWSFTVDANSNLILTGPSGASNVFSPASGMSLNGNTVIANGTTVWVGDDYGWLNGSQKFPSYGADGFNAGAYWYGGSPDYDSQLTIVTAYPG